MKIIPAIDLKNGHVVRARGGDRRHYRPLKTAAFPSSIPTDVARALSHHYDLFYIADLDRITDVGRDNDRAVADIRAALPDTEIWIDRGVRDVADCRQTRDADLGTPVIGSETLASTQTLEAIAQDDDNYILSLDFFDRRLRGPADLLESATLWPHTVIVIALNAVGTHGGPDLQLCDQIRELAGDRRVVYGGGVSGEGDLKLMGSAGLDGALVARLLFG